MGLIAEVECEPCKVDTKTRIVIKRKSLEEVSVDLPGYKEFRCSNIIKFKKRGREINNWIIEECRNNIIVKEIKIE